DVVDDSLPTWWSVWFDADDDGAQDLLVVHGGVAPRLHRNNRDGTFTRLSGGSLATAWGDGIAAVADFDNDGRLDVFLTQATTGRSTLH
ncbi:MAG: VCBS repeat-containing protein, partial [Blastocatellia bacterium]|nr:VCBS repeat-containing protein [Blastocatellia bacterium]